MPKCYPVSLRVENRHCLVVGGGQVAERKVRTLLEYGAGVTLVSPEITGGLKELAEAGRINHIGELYREDHLDGAFLVIGATDSDEVNGRVSRDAMKKGLLVNIVDDPPRGNFYVPAVVRRGPLQIAVSTDGSSPLLARKIREQLEKVFPPEYGSLVSMIGELRERVIRETADPGEKERILASLLDIRTMELIGEGKLDQAKERINNAYLGGGCKPQNRSC